MPASKFDLPPNTAEVSEKFDAATSIGSRKWLIR